MQNDLVFDIGANNGDDSAYYLHKGFRVVAIEANPSLCLHLRRRFSSNDRIVILNIGIAGSPGKFTFWICDDHPEWSSFDPDNATKKGSSSRPVIVDALPLSSVLAEHGMPYYCKVDIEGHDRDCVASFNRDAHPKFISIEMSYFNGDEDLRLLADVGYSRFKIVSQVTRKQPWPVVFGLFAALPFRIRSRAQSLEKALFGLSRDGEHVFAKGSSGPFGDIVPGRWRSRSEAERVWRSLRSTAVRYGAPGEWFDIHATD